MQLVQIAEDYATVAKISSANNVFGNAGGVQWLTA
jgi:hypothetical protein